ncbi:MAG TPA: CapA family protein [Caulobacteraceae bacterium]|nr:CapA family protein [Caulobacteraceae bacterium]
MGPACLALLAGAGAHAQPSPAPTGSTRDAAKELALKIAAPFTVATVGDIIEPQPLAREAPGYQQLIGVIRASDVGFGNMESSLIDIDHFSGAIAGTEAPLAVGQAIKDMGVKIVNHANNHAVDGGIAGMLSTDAALDAVGIVHAGTGHDLAEARAPHYLETAKGRVGVVGMFAIDDVGHYGLNYKMAEATYRVRGVGGAPGVDSLHLTDFHVVTPEQLQYLKTIRDELYGPAGDPEAFGEQPNQVKLLDDWYMAGDQPGSIHYAINPDDEKDILQSIRNGKTYADFMIATIHAHETPLVKTIDHGPRGGWGNGIDHTPADFLVKLAHDCIDNGADMFVAHGVHALSGVEIYRGKPIFYGLSNFVFQFGIQYGAGDDVFANAQKLWTLENPANQETVLATSRFEGGRLVEVRLYPVELGGSQRPLSQMGIPMAASPEAGRRILEEMQAWSKAFGTVISIENNVGVIRLATTSAPTPSRQ